MVYLFFAVLFAFVFFVTHIVCYRLRIMKFEPPRFLLIALVCLSAYGFFLKYFVFVKNGEGSGFFLMPLVLSSVVLCGLLCLAYVAECTAIENESPSMKIIKAVCGASGGRVTFEDLRNEFSDREFIHDRLNDLVKNGHVLEEGGLYRLTSRGLLIASVIKTYRNLIRRGLGG